MQHKLLLLVAPIAFLFLFRFYQQETTINQTPSEIIIQVPAQEEEKTLKDAKITGWVAYWDEENTLTSLNKVMGNLHSFSPIMYKIEVDGSLGRYYVIYRNEFLDLARKHELEITPVIGDDFDFARVSLLLYQPEVQSSFIQSLVNEANREGFSGWDINIESVNEEDKEALTSFIEKTAETLHKNNLKLNVVVFGRTGDDDNPAAKAYDYKTIGMVADEIRIMMYGAHVEDTEPGGQAPLSYIREVLSYATEHIPTEKIVVGLSTHGYDWGEDIAEALTFWQFKERIETESASVVYNEQVSSAVASYEKDGEEHVIWFENAQAITDKMEVILEEFNIDKFTLWRVGAEDPEIWEILKSQTSEE